MHTTLLLLLAPSVALASPLDDVAALAPGDWYQVPGSSLDEAGVYPSPEPPGVEGFSAIMEDWSGATMDIEGNRLLVWGGGHAGYGGNEIYAFDLDTLTWSRIWGPSTDIPEIGEGFCEEAYADGNPASRHTYSGLAYSPAEDLLVAVGGSRYECGAHGIDTWVFDTSTSDWTQVGDVFDQGNDWMHRDTMAADVSLDGAGSGRIYHQGFTGFSEFDPPSRTWVELSPEEGGSWYFYSDGTVATVDPYEGRFYFLGEGYFWYRNLSGADDFQIHDLATGAAVEDSQRAGIAFDSTSRKVVAWYDGPTVYEWQDDAGAWTTHTGTIRTAGLTTASASASEGLVAIDAGTMGRFAYSPVSNVFVVVNGVEHDVYLYRLSEGSGTPAPEEEDDVTPPAAPRSLRVQ